MDRCKAVSSIQNLGAESIAYWCEVEIHDRGFENGGYLFVKTMTPETGWFVYECLREANFNMGTSAGPVVDTWLVLSLTGTGFQSIVCFSYTKKYLLPYTRILWTWVFSISESFWEWEFNVCSPKYFLKLPWAIVIIVFSIVASVCFWACLVAQLRIPKPTVS